MIDAYIMMKQILNRTFSCLVWDQVDEKPATATMSTERLQIDVENRVASSLDNGAKF